ncbi:MAG: TetR/AcrR family transcriptional regulator [Pseudomonadota bacterium]
MKRPRGRPRGFDPEEALKAASERFRTLGYAATSLDDLAAATGLARPSLYAAFGDKKALYLAALARTHHRLEATFDALEAAALPKNTLLGTIFASTISGYLTGEIAPAGCIAVTTASAEAVADPEIRAALLAFLALQDRRMAEIFAAAGIPRPAASARIAMSVIHSLAIRARAGAPRAELEAIAADCITLLA